MLLLDTNVVLWTVVGDARLGQAARSRILTTSAAHVSSVSIAELTIKSMLGKLELPNDIDSLIAAEGIRELALTSEHTTALTEFPQLVRHDPFDRLLVAQAFRTGMDLITADRVLLGLDRDFIVDATL